MLYLAFKVLHILAVVMFLGNITTGIFWKEHADRTKDPGSSLTPSRASSGPTAGSPFPAC